MGITNNSRKSVQTAIRCLLFLCMWVFLPPQAVYGASSTVSVTLPVEQLFISESTEEEVSGIFPYELTPLEVGNPMPAGTVAGVYSFTIDGNATREIGPITFHSPGVYSYAVGRNPSAIPSTRYVYDRRIYRVSIYVSQREGELTQKMLVYHSDHTKTDGIRFENRYYPLPSDPSIVVDPPVKKTVSGSPANQSTFLFTLTAGNPANPMPEGSVNGVKTLSIVGSGEEDFGTWAYTTEGTYFYTIAEVNTQEKNYTYDTAIYTITDVVREVDGQLSVRRTVTNSSNKPVLSCIFINKYKGTTGGGSGSGGTDLRDRDRDRDKDSDREPGTVPGDVTVPSTGGGKLPSPMTGDDTLITPYVVAMMAGVVVAAGCIVWLFLLRRRRKDHYADTN